MQKEQTTCTILVATRNRARSLERLLRSLDHLQPLAASYEVLIVDNGSSDDTPRILAQWVTRGKNRQVLQVPQPGKARALNAAVRACRGELLAFLDDDVIVDPSYLLELWNYFLAHDCAAAQGAVVWPPESEEDLELQRLLKRFRSCIARADYPPNTPQHKLCGANIAVRRSMFEKIGLFDEQLGPGASGFSEDDELADRILAAGGWIGYIRQAQVVHEIDRSRLTEEYFHRRHRLQGRSRFVYRPRGLMSILPNLAKAVFHYIFYGMVRNVRRQYKAKGRYYHYREMLRLCVKRWTLPRDQAVKMASDDNARWALK